MQELVINQILTLISHFKITIPILGFFLLTSLNCGTDTVNTEEEAISVVKSLLNEEVDHWLTLCKQTSCSQEHINKSRSNYEHLNFVNLSFSRKNTFSRENPIICLAEINFCVFVFGNSGFPEFPENNCTFCRNVICFCFPMVNGIFTKIRKSAEK